jgi:hypothetical protein
MTESDYPAAEADGDLPRRGDAKMRECLKCKAPFTSMWNGERICGHCKKSQAWRSGAPSRSYSTGRRY